MLNLVKSPMITPCSAWICNPGFQTAGLQTQQEREFNIVEGKIVLEDYAESGRTDLYPPG